MKKFNFTIFIVCLLTIYGCKKENKSIENEIKKFGETEKLSGELIKKIELNCSFANLAVIDSFLIIQTREDKFFHIYNTNNYELLAEFGNKGRGPNEFIRPELLNQASYDNNMPLFNVYDYTRRRITQINIINAIKQEGQIFNQNPVPEEIDDYLTYFFYRDDNLLIATPEVGGRFIIYNDKNYTLQKTPFIPKVDFDIKESKIGMIYRSSAVVNKDLNLFASTTLHFGEIDFFDTEGNYISSSVFESNDDLQTELAKKNEDDIDLKIQTIDMDTKGNLIYGLNFNNRLSEFNTNPSKNMKNIKVQVFDWNGNAIKEYVLDKRYVTSFAVDIKSNKFYGFCPGESDYNIVSYEFKK